MKLIIGLDNGEQIKNVAKAIQAFKFRNIQAELVHVLGRLMESPLQSINVVPADAVKRFLKMEEDDAWELLTTAQKELKTFGLDVATKLLTGPSGNRMIDYADEVRGDLIALGPSGKNLYERMMIGSVSRKALTSSKSSILLVKKEIDSSKPLTIIIATDHSDYANRCIKRFRSWEPQNIGRIVITTVYPEKIIGALGAVMENFKGDVAEWVRKELEISNAKLIEELAWKNIVVESRVESGDVSETLERVMKEENADFIVLGAQGKGFQERLLVGSVSLDQGISKPYNALIMRDR